MMANILANYRQRYQQKCYFEDRTNPLLLAIKKKVKSNKFETLFVKPLRQLCISNRSSNSNLLAIDIASTYVGHPLYWCILYIHTISFYYPKYSRKKYNKYRKIFKEKKRLSWLGL